MIPARNHQSRYNGPSDADYMAAARRRHQQDGEVEIDALATVSRGSPGGAYVQAWVWVPREEATPEPAEELDDSASLPQLPLAL